ncbi:MAG: aldo/keto reductase, partial [Clostridia bacterium]|nr:aldo/keto reductase [Clostridia bacterium]
FDKREQSGKVRHFGVSNHSPYQIELLKKCVRQPLVANQLQFSIMHAGMVSTGMNVNIHSDYAIDRDGGVLDYCRLNDITIQPWSPFQHGMFEGVFLNNEKFPKVNAKIDEIAERHGVSNTAIAVAWILRHPAHMQPIIGSTNINRLRDCVGATHVELTGDEWYEILLAAGYPLP